MRATAFELCDSKVVASDEIVRAGGGQNKPKIKKPVGPSEETLLLGFEMQFSNTDFSHASIITSITIQCLSTLVTILVLVTHC